jgi:hypothetical protein
VGGAPFTTGGTITGNIFSDDQTTPTQNYGWQVQAGSSGLDVFFDQSNKMEGNALSQFGESAPGYSQNIMGSADNRVLNPCFAIDQRLEGAVVQPSGSAKIVDMYSATSGSNAVTYQRVAFNSNNCKTGLQIRVAAQYVPGTSSYIFMNQTIEAQYAYDLNYGLANASTTIFDICAQSGVAPITIPWAIQNSNSTRSFNSSFTITSSGVVQCFSFTIPGDTVGFISTTPNAAGLLLVLGLGMGTSQLTSTTNQWTSGIYYGSSAGAGSAAFTAQPANTLMQVSSFRFYLSPQDVPWVPRPYGSELSLVQRYVAKTYNIGTSTGTVGSGSAGAAGSLALPVTVAGTCGGTNLRYPQSMRAAPTVTLYSTGVASSTNWYDTTTSADVGAASALNIGTSGAYVACAANAGETVGNVLAIHALLDAQLQ